MYNTPYALGLAHPAFGTVASVSDLLRLGLCFTPRGPRLLSDATVRAMTTNQLGPWARAWDPDDVAMPTWGLGFMVRGQFGPARFSGDLLPAGTFGHGGASGCTLSINPVDGVVIAFVSNQHASTDREGFSRRISSVLNVVMAGQ
jgi:CubicO group peptidase (beta-lactamase class C family)